MSDIVARLRNWRTVHLTQLRYVMESAADEIQRLRLSQTGDCPKPENAANGDKSLTAAERSVLREVCEEYANEDNVKSNEIAYVIDRLLERTRSNDNTQDAAEPSPASAGARPVAWQLWGDQSDDGPFDHYITERSAHWDAERLRQENPAKKWSVVPLYRSPTLTDEEREAIHLAIYWQQDRAAEMHSRSWNAAGIDQDCDTLRGILERLG